jgi:hypothetical protein
VEKETNIRKQCQLPLPLRRGLFREEQISERRMVDKEAYTNMQKLGERNVSVAKTHLY